MRNLVSKTVVLAAWLGASGCKSNASAPSSSGQAAPPAALTARERAPRLTAPAAAPALPGVASPSAPDPRLGRIKTVFLVLMENKAWSTVKGSPDAPFLNKTLLPRASYAENYRGPLNGALHPSEPNYVWLEAGDNLGITDDDGPARNHRATPMHLVNQLEHAHVSWRAYEEDIAGDECPLERSRNYAPKHDPMVFFDDVTGSNDPKAPRCIEHVRPLVKAVGEFGDFESDLAANKVGRYNFITPNMCNDMHDECPPFGNTTRQGDDWLATWVPKIQASSAYQDDGAIFITWDEAGTADSCPSADCPIGMIVLSPLARGGGYTNTVAYDHSSTLRTVEEIFGVSPFLRAAASATDLSDLFKP